MLKTAEGRGCGERETPLTPPSVHVPVQGQW